MKLNNEWIIQDSVDIPFIVNNIFLISPYHFLLVDDFNGVELPIILPSSKNYIGESSTPYRSEQLEIVKVYLGSVFLFDFVLGIL